MPYTLLSPRCLVRMPLAVVAQMFTWAKCNTLPCFCQASAGGSLAPSAAGSSAFADW